MSILRIPQKFDISHKTTYITRSKKGRNYSNNFNYNFMVDEKYLFRITKLFESCPTSQEFRFPSGKLLFNIQYEGDVPRKFSFKRWFPKLEKKVLTFNGNEYCFKEKGDNINVFSANQTNIENPCSKMIQYTIANAIDPDCFEPAPLIIKNPQGKTVVEVIYKGNENLIFFTYYNGELWFITEKPKALDYLRYLLVPYQMFKEITFWQHLFRPSMDYNKMGYFVNEKNDIPLPVVIAIYMLGEVFADQVFYSMPGPSAG
jgi:hypothetical protein